jgi:PAX-interacting protein 1
MCRMETLKRHLLFSGQEGLQELKKIVIRLEEKIYITATNQVFAQCDSIITIFSRHEYTHSFIHVQMYV